MTFPVNYALSPTAGQGFTITGIHQYNYLGSSVSSAGDVNHDGIADLYSKHFKEPGRKPSGEVEGVYTRVHD